MDTLLNLSNRFFYYLLNNSDNNDSQYRELHCLNSSLNTFLRTDISQ